MQAGVYSATTHYLQAVAAAGTDTTRPVMAAMRAAPIDDGVLRFERVQQAAAAE
jgi:branched-chain amino acid transport system substrate-binding protein